jgi:hypothetical protein
VDGIGADEMTGTEAPPSPCYATRGRGRRVRYSPKRREALWKAVRAAEEEAMRSCESARDRPRAVREAKLRVLEEYGVLFMTRGGVPYRRGEAEITS